MKSTKITFINHASVIISHGKTSLLSDPWYYGDAFHKGWNLLVEQNKIDIKKILNDINYIWISHEHPDHFSVKFFLDFKELIIENSIVVLFQKTRDKRVVNFLRGQKIAVQEIEFNELTTINDDISLICIKDGFYDSALFVKTPDTKILNLNDCEVNSAERANEICEITGKCDVLLTQFSYAAWKGGKQNIKWRKLAAREKLESIKIQLDTFKPINLIPFASYIYFSNKNNFYLNDNINRPKEVFEKFVDDETNVQVLRPYDTFNGNYDADLSKKAFLYWEEKINNIHSLKINEYNTVDFDIINESFKIYRSRIFSNNSKLMIFFGKFLSPIKIFSEVIIWLNDINKTVSVDIARDNLKISNKTPHISMSSESLNFMFKNQFGFDTLTVNGCFEEIENGGFIRASKALAVENLNNMGIHISPKIIFNFGVISLFFQRIRKVRKKLNF